MTGRILYDNWHLTMNVPEKALPFFERALDQDDAALLASLIEKGENKGLWKLEAIYPHRPDIGLINTNLELAAKSVGDDIPDYKIGPMPQKNWLKESLISFPPVSAGRYYIYGSHIKKKPPMGRISLMIDAATAFGSGEHQTTQGCLLALDDYAKRRTPEKILDMGCGSGILALAAAKTFKKPVYAVDIDPESVRVTAESARKNKLDKYIDADVSNGYRKLSVRSRGPYDLILSNILARPLIGMARSLAKNLKPGGEAILSGLLVRQAPWVTRAHERCGLILQNTLEVDGWNTLVFKRPS